MGLAKVLARAILHVLRVLACLLIPYIPVSARWKNETICRRVIEALTGQRFPQARPTWLKNPITGHCLELDCYNEKLKIALEYNGEQHYKYTPIFHKDDKYSSGHEKFQSQVDRDEIKKVLCDRHGVALIIVPHTIKRQNLCSYILGKLRRIRDIRSHNSI